MIDQAPDTTITSTPLSSPSLWEQIETLGNENGLIPNKQEEKPKTLETVYEKEDLKGLVEFPFDISSLLTKHKGFELTEEESDRLTKLFLKPFQRTFGNTENMDWLLFGMAMVSITTEKILMYKAHIAELKQQQQTAINRSK